MGIAASILPEFDHETSSTRKMLELVSARVAGFRPHEKSWTAGELALHLANLLIWVKLTLEGTEIDMSPGDGESRPVRVFESTEKTLGQYDENVALARAAIESASDADMIVGWSLKSGGNTIFTLPRVAVLRSFVMNHMIHHRGQLSVYLRMQNVALPDIYGTTADSLRR